MSIDDMAILDRRRLEAEVLGPMIRAFQAELGEARANEIARGVIVEIAREQGREMARREGKDDLKTFVQASEPWTRGGALEVDELEKTSTRYFFNVTRCKYAEMYRQLGVKDLGFILSCDRDFSLSEGFNPRMKLTRTQTIMQGAPYCDFRYTQEGD